MRNTKLSNRQSGYTLLELAVVILIVGVMAGLAISYALPVLQTAKRLETQEKIRIISKALNSYAVNNYRLPCPAPPNLATLNPPFGYERGSGANGDILTDGNCNTTGIIPVRTLGLSDDMIFDGFGHPFTYAVSLIFTEDTTNNRDIHPACRTIEWYTRISNDDTGGGNSLIYLHKNPRKARFCCPDESTATNTDITIQNEAGVSALAGVRSAAVSATAANSITTNGGTCPNTATCSAAEFECCTGYDDEGTPFSVAPNASVNPADRTSAIAYALISHGNNGLNAAYNLNSGNRPATPPTDANEAENADNDRIYRDIYEKSETYDDILYWRTQDLIFAELGESCAVP